MKYSYLYTKIIANKTCPQTQLMVPVKLKIILNIWEGPVLFTTVQWKLGYLILPEDQFVL